MLITPRSFVAVVFGAAAGVAPISGRNLAVSSDRRPDEYVRPATVPFTAASPEAGVPVTALRQPDLAVEAGAKLFVAYNCADCHGAGGSGAMGPSLQDNRWRFGGSAAEIYRSIADGRPEGMPAWGPLIPAAHIRQLVAYSQSLGAGKDVTTENFTGETVERAGR